MASHTHRRSEWHQHQGKWSRSLGERGIRVRLFQRRTHGVFYREVWRLGAGKDRRSLETSDRSEAERYGRQLLAALLQDEAVPTTGPVTLQCILDRYRRDCPDYLDNKPHTKVEVDGRVKVLLAYFGADCDVRMLTSLDVLEYTKQRLAGGIIRAEGSVTGPVRARSVQADLSLLRTALKWATSVSVGAGKRLLDTHPLIGVKIPSEKNPQRPVATWERFEATRRAVQTLAAEAKHASERLSWVRVEFALVLMEATGRRRGSVCQLAWKDFDFTHREIHWRAETDKKGREWMTPIPNALLEEIEKFRQQLGLCSPWVFPAPRNPSKPVNGNWLSKRIRQAERKAKLPKLRGGLCHPYRRKWATERKHFPLKDVAAAGGWKNVNTLLTCYQHEDRETMLLVMTEPRKLTTSITLDHEISRETDSQTDPRGPKQQAPHNVSCAGPST